MSDGYSGVPPVMSSSRDSGEPQTIDFHPSDSRAETLRKIRTADSVAIPLDVFEKLYLNPQQPAAGHLRKTFGNPTPVALIGFLISSTPLSIALMGWRGAGGGGGAILTTFIFFGGMLQIISGTMEWILGNTFSSVLFFTYGAFWLVQGTTLQPFYGVGTNYSLTGNSLEGLTAPGYFATTAFYLVFLALLSFIFMICSLRTNVTLFAALLLLVFAFGTLAGAYFNLALGNVALAGRLQITGGAFTFALSMCIWWLLFAQMLESVDFPISLPVGDLSMVIPGKSLKRPKQKDEHVE